jgi:tRNA G10  N-methylase Trm11
MSSYIFILGQSTDLVKQELINLLEIKNIHQSTIGDNFIVADLDTSPEKLIDALGGTIKIARLLDEIDDLQKLDIQKWQKFLKIEEGKKIKFGFSLYNGSRKNYQWLQQLALSVKKDFKAQGLPARLVTSRQPELSSVIVSKNKLLNYELVIIKHENKWLLGLTEAIQDFAKYGHRDMNRPQRDDRSGMLPPKIAQMMINLTGPNRQRTLLDPFCGSGTILQEAALMQFDKIIGTDISPQAIKDTRANLDWLKQHYTISKNIQLEKLPAENLSKKFDPQSIDLIVAEPFMGDARLIQRSPDAKTIRKITTELQDLYSCSFEQFRQIIAPMGVVVFIFPIIHNGSRAISTLDKNKIAKFGWQLIRPSIDSDRLSPAGNIVYQRPGQKVHREITVWRPS